MSLLECHSGIKEWLLKPARPFSEGRLGYEAARIVLMGIPLDMTVSFRPGTRFAPSAIREISWSLEDYNYLTDEDILDVPFFDVGDLFLTGDLNDNLNQIQTSIREILKDKKIPVSIGGEHLITFPIVQVINEAYPDLHVVVFDAHTDLSDSYRKMELSHAAVMRLVYNILGPGKLFIFGVRSGTKEDKEFLKRNIYSSYKPPLSFIEGLKDKPLYISIDMDVLDPSVAPGVTTPELGGWRYEEICEIIRGFTGLNIVGVDITEISPHYDPTGITPLVGAAIVREIMFLLSRILESDLKDGYVL